MMVIVKLSYAIKGPRVKLYGPLCGGLYKEYHGYIVTWSGTEPYSNMNCFTWYKEGNYWIFPWDKYNEEYKNWQIPIHDGQFLSHALKKKRITERTCSNFQSLSSLMELLENETWKSLSNPTSTNAVITLSGMEYGMYSTYQTPTINTISGIFL